MILEVEFDSPAASWHCWAFKCPAKAPVVCLVADRADSLSDRVACLGLCLSIFGGFK